MSDQIVNHPIKYQQFLRDLKSTVEGLFVGQVTNVWFVYGGLNRLHNAMEKIFKHGCKVATEDASSNYWKFIEGLEWLQPSSTLLTDSEYKSHMPQHIKHDKASIWLFSSLESHSLSQKLSWLLSDKTHLTDCYQSQAFLCQKVYIESVLICLRAVERNQPSLICEIDPCLFLNKMDEKNYHKAHRRCSSFPDNHYKSNNNIIYNYNVKVGGKLKPWTSMPNLISKKIKPVIHSRTTPSTPIHFRYTQQTPIKKKLSRRFKKVKHVMINNCDIVEHMPSVSNSLSTSSALPKEDDLVNLSFKSLPAMRYKSKNVSSKLSPKYGFVTTLSGEKDYKKKPKKTFIEDGGMSVLPMSTGYFPRPSKGQSLTDFLSSSQFAGTNAELDRENAHFSISEAIISAVEQMRCRREDQLDDSDEEIRNLKQRIRLRRHQKIKEKLLGLPSSNNGIAVSPVSTTTETHSDSLSSDDVDDLEIDEACNLTDHRGVSMSMASLYSEADIFKKPREAPDGASDILSAEGVALSLISKFNEKQLPSPGRGQTRTILDEIGQNQETDKLDPDLEETGRQWICEVTALSAQMFSNFSYIQSKLRNRLALEKASKFVTAYKILNMRVKEQQSELDRY